MEDFPVNRIYYFDYSALIVELVILAFILIRRMYRGRTNRYYFFLTLIALCTTVTDIFRSVPHNNSHASGCHGGQYDRRLGEDEEK